MSSKKEVLNLGILYLSLHNQLRKKWGVGHVVTRKEIHVFLGKHFLIPKFVLDAAIKELEQMKLLEKIDKNLIKIKDIDFDFEKDSNKLFTKLHIF